MLDTLSVIKKIHCIRFQSQAKTATLQAEVDRLHIEIESGKFELESLKTKYDEQKAEREALIDKLRDESTELKIQNSQLRFVEFCSRFIRN